MDGVVLVAAAVPASGGGKSSGGRGPLETVTLDEPLSSTAAATPGRASPLRFGVATSVMVRCGMCSGCTSSFGSVGPPEERLFWGS